MSRGNKVLTFRLPEELLERMRLQILACNESTCDEPLTWSDFVRKALEERLGHLRRVREYSARRVTARRHLKEFHANGGAK